MSAVGKGMSDLPFRHLHQIQYLQYSQTCDEWTPYSILS